MVRFTVPAMAPLKLPKPANLPKTLNTIPALTPTLTGEGASAQPLRRTVTLHVSDDGTYLQDGQPWSGKVSETPKLGTTEDWDIVNLTDEDHPMHLHLVQFQVQWHQAFRRADYQAAWTAENGSVLPLKDKETAKIDVATYLPGAPESPKPTEAGWKDTVVVPAAKVTRIRVRWAPQDATPAKNAFPFVAKQEPGYAWHCHMLEHEDNEMMRPFKFE
jgi:FtsP/CotA-like multicopper oxidase with cupredoxin domain